MLEIFIEFLDGIYWDGYAKQLAADNPAAFQFEWNQFLEQYNP